jgi:hypothetical protein
LIYGYSSPEAQADKVADTMIKAGARLRTSTITAEIYLVVIRQAPLIFTCIYASFVPLPIVAGNDLAAFGFFGGAFVALPCVRGGGTTYVC